MLRGLVEMMDMNSSKKGTMGFLIPYSLIIMLKHITKIISDIIIRY